MARASGRQLRAPAGPHHARLELDAGGPAVRALEKPLDFAEERHQRAWR
jgi:hypothetical protein